MPVQQVWLPLPGRTKNFLCYIGRGVVSWMGGGLPRGGLVPSGTLGHRWKRGLRNECGLFPPGGGCRYADGRYAARCAIMWGSLAEIARSAPFHGLPSTSDREVMPGSVSRFGRCRTSWRFARKVASRGLGNWLVK